MRLIDEINRVATGQAPSDVVIVNEASLAQLLDEIGIEAETFMTQEEAASYLGMDIVLSFSQKEEFKLAYYQ